MNPILSLRWELMSKSQQMFLEKPQIIIVTKKCIAMSEKSLDNNNDAGPSGGCIDCNLYMSASSYKYPCFDRTLQVFWSSLLPLKSAGSITYLVICLITTFYLHVYSFSNCRISDSQLLFLLFWTDLKFKLSKWFYWLKL